MHYSPRSSGKWASALLWMRAMWMLGRETVYLTPEFSPVRHEKIEVIYDDIHADDSSLERIYIQWLGEMEMFKQEGGMRAYQHYREYMEKIALTSK